MLSRNELDAILSAAEDAERNGVGAALATVVAVEGSTYRRPGARMLVRSDGIVAGGVSGGCLEADVIRKARFSLRDRRSRIHRYDTTDEDDFGFGAGLNCRGTIDILIEPLVTDRALAHLEELRRAREFDQPAVIVLELSDLTGESAGIVRAGSSLDGVDLNSIAAEVVAQQRYRNVTTGNGRELLFDYVPASLRILLFGAGPEAASTAAIGKALGCVVTIVDERPGYLGRLPQEIRSLSATVQAADTNLLSAGTACVVATHNAAYDGRVLRRALASDCFYIGLLGPKKRALSLLETLREEGWNPADLHRIYAPVGLDLGAETPEQIALSVISEIHAVRASRSGGFLRERRAPMHEVAEGSQAEMADAASTT